MSRNCLAALLVVVAFMLGVFVEQNFQVIGHAQYCCPYLNKKDCCSEKCGKCSYDSNTKCKCEACDCCGACPGKGGSNTKCVCEDCACCDACPGKLKGCCKTKCKKKE